AGVGIQIEMQSNLLEADGHLFGNTQRAAKVEIALRSNRCAAQWNAQSGSDCTQRDARASYERFQQHVRRARAGPITSCCRVKSCFDARFSGFDFAGDILADSPLGAESNQRGFRTLAIL